MSSDTIDDEEMVVGEETNDIEEEISETEEDETVEDTEE